MNKSALKFLHLADLHLDRPLYHSRLNLPYEKVQQRNEDQREALARVIDLARAEKVDVILIAGDFWEEDNLDRGTVPFVVETLGSVEIPIVIAPGNHDYYSPSTHYSNDILLARNDIGWPSNVHIFRDYNFSHLTLPGLDGVVITGLAYRSSESVQLRRIAEKIEIPDGELRLCVIHGSREDDLPPGKERTLPFTDEELLAKPFDYTALGHFHKRSTIKDKNGKIRAAYPGSTCALMVDETGPKGVLIGVVEKGGISEDNLEFHAIDRRQIHRLNLDINGCKKAKEIEKMIRVEGKHAGVGKDDITLVELTGAFPTGNRIVLADEFVESFCFHLHIDTTEVLPEWEIKGEAETEAPTTENLFRVKLQEMIIDASERGDSAETVRLQNALFHGLDALQGRSISSRSNRQTRQQK